MIKRNQSALGIDLSDKTANFCVMRADTGIAAEGRVALTVAKLAELWRQHGPVDVVVLEAGTPATWVQELFTGLGARVIVADARKLRAVTDSVRKSDVRDARMLARLGLADEELLAPTYVRAPEHRLAMALLKVRDQHVRTRTATILEIRSQVKLAGHRLPSCDAEDFHEQEELVPEELREVLAPSFELLRTLQGTVATFDKKIKEEGKRFPAVAQLAKIDGVGPITALAFVAVVGDPSRFAHTRDIGAYFGLVPRRDQSGQAEPHLRISKAGCGFLRRLLTQCAQSVCKARGKDTAHRRWALRRIALVGKPGKRKVIVAVARKLAVLMLSLWKSGQDWTPLHRVPPESVGGAPQPVVSDECASPLAPQAVPKNAPSSATRTHACTESEPLTKSADGSTGRSGAPSPDRGETAKRRVARRDASARPATPSAPVSSASPPPPACAGGPAGPASASRPGPKPKRGRCAAEGMPSSA